MDYNKVTLMGRLTKDPDETRYTPTKQKVVIFNMATGRKWKDKTSGEVKEEASYHRIVCYEPNATVAEKYLKKGKRVFVEGELRSRSYEDKGITKYVVEVYATKVIVIDFSDNSTASQNTDNHASNVEAAQATEEFKLDFSALKSDEESEKLGVDDIDIPF